MQRKKMTGLIIVLFICLLTLTTPFQNFASFPQELRLFSGQEKNLNLSVPVQVQVSVKNPDIVKVNGQSKPSLQVDLASPLHLQSEEIGQTEIQLNLFGAVPIKKWKVHVIPELRVIPGGQTIGVKMKSKGVLVVGHHQVHAKGEQKISPGEQAKIQIGDIITEINGQKLRDISEVSRFVEEAGKKKQPLNISILRKGKTIRTALLPAYDIVDKAYRLGLYIRDSAAGVGTLTFYAPDQKVYGALGHVITDLDTQTPIPVGQGQILHSNVTSISKGKYGVPGEKRAHFFENGKVLGSIEKNTAFGIFGKMTEYPEHGLMKKAIPVALREEVKEGKAYILTVLEGQKVDKFDIEIVHVARQDTPDTKGLVIKITDPRLIEKTGGIVQGMSGSPIIQDGKLVGAVTHVFVNDPTSGYGCFIEWMLQDAGILQEMSEKGNSAA